jgi:hypothetical protein
MFEHESFFFVGVIVCIFLFWLATGGPTHPISFAGPLLSGPGPLGGGTYLSLPRANNPIGSVSLDESHASGAGNGSTSGGVPADDFGPASPYRGQVTLSHYLSSPSASDVRNEYLQLSLSYSAKPVNISGWKVVSLSSGNSGTIPLGTEVPTTGLVSPFQSITLQQGDTALISTARSPLGGSFRENKCVGYFSSYQTFVPSLPLTCPLPKDEFATHYGPDAIRDSACSDYVQYQTRRCEPVNSPPVGLTSSCQAFVSTYLNYSGCVLAHQSDSDFKSTTWRIYLGQNTSMWRPNHETIRLLDSDGKTVDQFSY